MNIAELVDTISTDGHSVDVAADHVRVTGSFSALRTWSLPSTPTAILLPLREGELIDDPSRLLPGDPYSLTYPGTASMQCVVLFGDDSSIFIGGRPSFEYTRIEVERTTAAVDVRFESLNHDYVVIPFESDWREAADRYQEIFSIKHNAVPARRPRYMVQLGVRDPARTVHISDFLDLIPVVDRVAEQLGDGHIVHLYGTSEWGFDRMFPDYTIDPGLGGEASFRKLIDHIQASGFQSSHHYNPRIADSDWLAWNPDCRDAVVTKNSEPVTEPYKDHVHYVMSPNHQVWYDRCFETIEYLYGLGLDYLEIDQFTYQRNFFDQSRPIARGYERMVDQFIQSGHRFWLEGVSDVFRLPPGNFYQILIRDRAQRWDDGENRRGYPFGRTFGEFFMHLWPESEVSYQILTENRSMESVSARVQKAKELNVSVFDLELGFYDQKYLQNLGSMAEILSRC